MRSRAGLGVRLTVVLGRWVVGETVGVVNVVVVVVVAVVRIVAVVGVVVRRCGKNVVGAKHSGNGIVRPT